MRWDQRDEAIHEDSVRVVANKDTELRLPLLELTLGLATNKATGVLLSQDGAFEAQRVVV